MKTETLLFIATLFFATMIIGATVVIGAGPEYIIEGDTVYIDDTKVYLSATPHTLVGNGWVIFNLTSKVYTGNIDAVIGFDYDSIVPEEVRKFQDGKWVKMTGGFNSINYDYQGMNKWWYKQNIPIVQDQDYAIAVRFRRTDFSVPYKKYWFAIKPSSETIAQAIANGHFYALDPWTSALGEGLMAYYDFENGSATQTSLVDRTDQVHGALTNMNPANDWVAGALGFGLDLDGINDYISIGNFSETKPENFSISLWLEADNILGASFASTNVSANDGALWGLHFRDAGDNVEGWVSNGVAGDPGILSNNSFSRGWNATHFPDDAFVHVVLSVNGSHFAYYHNGTLISRQVRTLVNTGLAYNFSIGRLGELNGNYYNGVVDEMGIWNRSLDASEVTSLWNSGIPLQFVPENFNITLLSPENNFNTTNPTVDFACYASSTNPIINVSLLFDSVLNQTNSTGTNNTIYNFTIGSVAYGNHDWTCEVWNDAPNGAFPEARDLTVFPFTEIGFKFNSTTSETKEETFSINITSNGSTPTASLVYAGDSTPATVTNIGGDNYTIVDTIDIPLGEATNTFYFDIDLGVNFNSTLQTQSANVTILTLCNGTYTTNYINITFKNETLAEEIVTAEISSTWYYWLGSGNLFKSYTLLNTTENPSYALCLDPTDEPLTANVSMIYDNSYSEQRNFIGEFSLTNITTNQTLYLLPTPDGIYVTFQVINVAEQLLSGVFVNATKGGALISNGITDAAGTITFFLDPDTSYTFMFDSPNYNIFTTTITPSQTSYTVTLGQIPTTIFDFTKGINYAIRPSIRELRNNTIYDINFTLTSSFWEVDSFGFTLTNLTGTILNSTTVNSNGGVASVQLNTSNQTYIIMSYFWEINGNYTNVSTHSWWVTDGTGTGFGLNTFFQRLSTYLASGMFGLDNFGLTIIIFLTIFLFVGIMSFKFGGIQSPIPLSLLLFALVYFFDVVLDIIPSVAVGSTSVANLPTILAILFVIGAVVREGMR